MKNKHTYKLHINICIHMNMLHMAIYNNVHNVSEYI